MTDPSFTPFLLLTPRLILLPTPRAITQDRYAHMYGDLHADPAFCHMAFGPDFPLRVLDLSGKVAMIQREVASSWQVRGMGDMAVGLWDGGATGGIRNERGRLGKLLSSGGDSSRVYLVQGKAYEELVGTESTLTSTSSSSSLWLSIDWVGYCGIRDATTLSLPSVRAGLPLPSGIPAWQDMVEVRYGFHSRAWGRGFGTEALHAVMTWGKRERGVRRYIAETERANVGSAKILEKSGFVKSGTEYFEDPSLVEWMRSFDVACVTNDDSPGNGFQEG